MRWTGLPDVPNIRVSKLETDAGSSNRLWIASVFSEYTREKIADECRSADRT